MTEDDKLVGIFDGFESKVIKYEYSTSWDWLMPVVEKIENIREEDDGRGSYLFSFSSGRDWAMIYHNDFTQRSIAVKAEDTKLQSVYAVVVEFIKWYNQNKK